jgi:hypothetical protein
MNDTLEAIACKGEHREFERRPANDPRDAAAAESQFDNTASRRIGELARFQVGKLEICKCAGTPNTRTAICCSGAQKRERPQMIPVAHDKKETRK